MKKRDSIDYGSASGKNITPPDDDHDYLLHLAAIVQSTDDAIVSKSVDGTIKSWNKGAEKMFGYTSNEIVGKNIMLIVPPTAISEEKQILSRIVNDETISHYETLRIRKSGESLYVSLTVSPIKDRQGNIIGISKIARDITARKNAELNIEKYAAEMLFQNSEKEKRASELILANKELAYQNQEKESRAEELILANKELAYQNAEKEKRAHELVLANKELAFQNTEKEKRALELMLANKELAYQNTEKEKRAALLVVVNRQLAVQNNEKEKRAKDLASSNTELKTAKEQLQSVIDELESFSYSVSHDLRAPLRAIHGYTQMMKRGYESQLDAEGQRLMVNIMHNAKKMGQLIDDLLAFSRLSRKELVKSNISMHDLVLNICSDLKFEYAGRDIEFDIKILPPAWGDTTAIKQLLFNLISNAVKYTKLKELATIEIGSDNIASETVYYIRDNGAGFDMRYADKLFGVFQRLHSDQEFEGTGVGLAIVQRIILKHGGRVWAEAKEDEGATFYFTLNTQNI